VEKLIITPLGIFCRKVGKHPCFPDLTRDYIVAGVAIVANRRLHGNYPMETSMQNPANVENAVTGQLKIEVKPCGSPVSCAPIVKGSGVELREIYASQLAYIRTHADKLGISESRVSEVQTLLGLHAPGAAPAPSAPQELLPCDNLAFCTPLHKEPSA